MVTGVNTNDLQMPDERQLPPVMLLGTISLILIVISGILTAAYLPAPVPLGPPIAFTVAAALVLLVNVVLMSRVREFAWGVFWKVGGWALLAYVFIAGMLELIFILDATPGPVLALLSVSLLIYGIDVPLLLAFSVARFQPVAKKPAP